MGRPTERRKALNNMAGKKGIHNDARLSESISTLAEAIFELAEALNGKGAKQIQTLENLIDMASADKSNESSQPEWTEYQPSVPPAQRKKRDDSLAFIVSDNRDQGFYG